MEIEIQEIQDFLAVLTPFDQLSSQALAQLVSAITVRYMREGKRLVCAPESDGLWIVRSGCLVTEKDDGSLLGKYGEGDVWVTSHYTNARYQECGVIRADEDTLIYAVACEGLIQVANDAFQHFFEASSEQRLKKATVELTEALSQENALVSMQTRDLLSRKAVWVSVGETIFLAAETMTNEKVSCVLVSDGQGRLAGLVTDRDMRSRVIAKGLSPDEPVAKIMTAKPTAINHRQSAFQALTTMVRENVHHLPVLDDHQDVLGVITNNDLIRYESHNPIYLVSDIHKAETVAQLAALGKRLPKLQVRLVRSGAGPRQLGEVVSMIADALTTRLIVLAQTDLGSPPVAFAWIVGGSQARLEQTSHSDQDNGLILSDTASAGDDDYFAQLAKFVCDGLNACGFYYCPGDIMATTPRWRQKAEVWSRYFERWIHTPEPEALMLSSIFFDLRTVYGNPQLLSNLRASILQKTSKETIFQSYMAKNVLSHRVPLGFFRNFVVARDEAHKNTLDLKHHGLAPIVDIARLHALSSGVDVINTIERLHAVSKNGQISSQGATSLIDAFDYIGIQRLRYQTRQIRCGQNADNFVPLADLSKLEQEYLRDVFSAIITMQDHLSYRYGHH